MTIRLAGSASRGCFADLSASSTATSSRNFGSLGETSRRAFAWARGVASFGVALLLVGAFCLPAQAQTLMPSWYQGSPETSPPARQAAAMAYDAANGQVVLFGGMGNSGLLNDTWLWNGTNWTNANPATNPPARYYHAMAYDAASGQVVLFGGSNGGLLGDTWLWNGTNWSSVTPGTSPSPRIYPDMAPDAAGHALLFGGDNETGILGDTWEWNGTTSTWNNLASSGPSARENRADMAYNAAQQLVVLFGGLGNTGDLNDTWEYGTNWSQVVPGLSPPARSRQAVAYYAAGDEVLLFGGLGGSGLLADTWVFDGTNWTEETPATSPPPAREYHSMANDATGHVVLFGGDNGTVNLADTWEWGLPGNFGYVNVCPAGQSTPSPCSNTVTLTYTAQVTTTFGTSQVLTEGATGLDFTLAGGGTCTGTIQAGVSCAVNVKFAPIAPGIRMGAVNLFDNSSDLLLTTPIYGVGQGPAIAFSPGTETTVSTGSFALNHPAGVALDGLGNLYISDNGNGQVLKIGNGTQTVVYGPTPIGAPLAYYPQGLAVDGAGNLFVADNNRNLVVEVPAGCTSPSCQISLGSNLAAQLGVAVDGAGDLFMGDFTGHEVVEIPAGCTSPSCQIVVYSPGVSSNPVGLALDSAGSLFVADFGINQVVKIQAGCTGSNCQTTVGTTWTSPEAVAVDAAGDVFVAQEVAPYVVEVPAGCASSACQIILNVPLAYGLAFDGTGNLYVPELSGNQVIKVNYSQPPALSFASTNVGSTSSDSPQSITMQNIGNQTLNATSPGLAVNGPNFVKVPGSGTSADCTSSFALAAGALCNLSISFEPQIAGNPISSTAVFTDNALNANPATQTIGLSGTGVAVVTNYSLTVSTAGSGSGTLSGTNCSTGSYPQGTTVTCTETPTGGSQFAGWSGGTCSGVGSCSFSLGSNSSVVANFSLSYSLTVTVVGTGSGTVADNTTQISCNGANGSLTGTCSGSYASGTLVTLTASASGSSVFVGWGGACSGASSLCNVTMSTSLNVSASFVAPGASQSGILKPLTAGVVYGQGGSFTSSAANNGGVSANSLYFHAGLVLDGSGNLYVDDAGNNRVLFYPRGSTIAARVYGQGGSFTTNNANNGGVSANSLWNPEGIALDSSGNLYVADQYNNRVLFYPAGSTTATRVYGQGGSFTANSLNNGGISANSLGQPWALALDGSGNLYVSEYQNSRVLFYPAGSTTATQVYGQGGSFTSGTANNGGISANSLNGPTGVALDSSGDLYVADIYNNRVLEYPFNSTTATQVYGQGGSFTSGTANNGGVSASSLNNPMALTLDSSGDLYVADRSNNRVLFYPFGSTTATRVYGQPGSFATTTANNGGISANTLSQPWAVALDSSENLYVTDYSNNRVLEYGPFGNFNVCPAGQSTPAPCNRTIVMSYYAAPNTTFGATEVVTQGAPNLDFTLGSRSTCIGTSSAGGACTVNVNFAPLAPGLRLGAVQLFSSSGNLLASTPAYGIGQAPESAFGPATTYTSPFSSQSKIVYSSQVTEVPNLASPGGGLTTDAAGNLYQVSNQPGLLKVVPGGTPTTVATGFSNPQGVAIDGAGNFYVADQGLGTYGEVVELAPGCASLSCASVVYAASASPGPYGVAVDGSGDVFISGGAIGALEIPARCSTSNCQIPLYSPGSGSNAAGVAVDAAGDVFIADSGLDQVVEIPAGCTTAGCQTTVGTGWVDPLGVAVDPAGDVLVADLALTIGAQASAGGVVEVPAGCTNSNCQTLLLTAGAPDPFAVTVSATGQIFAATDGPLFEINQSQPPSLSFALTSQGSTSTDSPNTVSVQNIGNQPLTVALSPIPDSNFVESSLSNCGAAFTLAAGAICYENFRFTPQATGYLSDVAYFSDNTLNLASSVVAQPVNLSGVGDIAGQAATVIVPNVVGMTQANATSAITSAGLALGSVNSEYSSGEPAGSAIGENPAAGTLVTPGSAVKLLISIGEAPPPTPNPLTFENNYFVTGDYASAGVTLRGTGIGGMATGTITISDSVSPGVGVPKGVDIIDAFLYWQTVESTPTPSANTGTFLGYSITGQQIGSDLPYTDPISNLSGTLRAYRADVNTYFTIGANGVRFASGSFSVSLPDGGTALPLTEGASLIVIYRALVAPGSSNPPSLPLKAVVIYDGSVIQTASTTQNIQGFYDSLGAGESTALYSAGGNWSNNTGSVTLGMDANQYGAPLNSGNAYVAQIFSTPVNNGDNDGILNAWKAGPPAGDFFAGQPGYYEVKTQSWVPLPGAKTGEKDLFVQFDYMCGAVLANGSCDPTEENLYPSPDSNGNDPLAMVQQAFAATGIVLHLQVGNAVAETTCVDSPGQLCQFPGQPGVIGWKNSLEFSKVWPRNFASCAAGGDCTARFPYGQKDSYHYVLFGHSLAIPAWNTRFGNLTGIQVVAGGTTTITTTGIPACPSRITIAGVLGNPTLNGVYNTMGCTGTTMTIATPSGVPTWTYPNTLAEPVIGITSGTVTSISGYSDLGGADSAVSLALWEMAPNQNMSKRANVIAGTLFHEIGHTLGLSHGGLYYQTPSSYIPTFDVNCKPNYQSSMNYLFQLDGVGPNAAVAYSNQQLDGEAQSGPPSILNDASLSSITQLTDASGNPATFSTSAWYSPNPPTPTSSAATLHCDGTPLTGDTGYRVNGSVSPISPSWTSGQNIAFDGVSYTTLAGYNDVANIDLRQVGATGGEFASLASVLSFGSSATPLSVAAGGNVTLGSGGTVALGSGGTVTLGSGGNVTLGSGGTITPGSGGSVTLNNGGNATLSSGGTIALGSGGTVTLGSGGNVTLGSGGTITLGSGGNVTLGSGGNVTLGSGGTISLGGGISVTIPASGGAYAIPAGGGTITLGSGGNVTLGSGGNVTLGSGGTIAMGSGGNVTLGSGGNVTLGSGGTITLGSGGNVTLGSGGNVTLGSGGTIALGSGGNVTMGSGGNVTLGSGGNVTMGSGGNVTLGSGGNVTLGSGGTVTLGSGGNVTLGSGGLVTMGSGGNIAMGSGGTVTLGSGGSVTLGSGGGQINGVTEPAGVYNVSSGGTVTLGSGGNVTLGSGGNVTMGSGGTITMGSGGNVTLGSGGNVTLGSGGVVALGSGGNIALGSGGNIALGSGGNITLGSGGVTTTEMDYVTANSVVRPPPSATYTQPTPTSSVTVNWMPPAFGVVQTYTISRSVSPGSPVVIGSVSGENGNPPATTFTDITPPAGTLIYTISTTLLPVAIDPTQRQSAPSPPAILTINQNIALGALPSSVTLPGPQTVTATAESNGVANGLAVSFSTSGPCSIATGSQSINTATGVSSASVTLSSTGSCVITASQAGATTYNAASPVSGTFMILPAGSNTTSQTITFPQLTNVQYGSTFSLSASSSAGLTVSFTASGPCTTSGTTTGVGLCQITASQAGNNTYSAASVSQSFNVTPAPLKVAANNLTSQYGQSPPSLTYTITGFVNNDLSSVVSGAPALTTTATATSNVGSYPITVSTGTLTAANYSFFYVNGALNIQIANQTALTLTTTTPLTYNQSETPHLTGGSSGGALSYNLTGPCTVSGGALTANSGTGSCTLTATMAGNSNYNPVTSTPANTVTLGLASQTITFTTNAPSSAAYNSTFTVAATGGASGNAVTFTSAGSCSNVGATYTITNSTGTCSVIANQAANTNYSLAPTVTQTVNTSGPAVTVVPSQINFGTVNLGSITTQTITVTNVGTAPVTISQPLISIVKGGNSNEFVAVSLCPASLAVGKSCAITIAFVAGPFYTPQTATLEIMDNAPNSPQPVTLTATVLQPQTITFTTNPPASTAYKSTFTVAATGGGSGNPVTFTSSGVCSNSGATYTMTSGTGTCSVIANQAGNSSYAAAQVTKTVTATVAAQTITFTTSPPTSAAYKSSFTVAATGGGSGNAVTFTSSGVCSNSGATYTMTSGTGTCSVIANQAGNSSYAAATAVTKSVSATQATQTITFTTNPPANAVYKTSFTVAATGGGSGNAVTYTSSGVCSNSGATYTMTSGTGTCSVIANQAGNSYYAAATPVTKTVSATQATQTITFTTNPPASAVYKSTFSVAATGGSGGNAVTYTSSGVCSNSGATYTMTSGTGTCSVVANQAANSNYAAATTVTKTVNAALATQTITFTTNPPASAVYKSSFTVAATGGASGNAVTYTSSGSCTNSGATYTITSTTGTCSVIVNQTGNSNYGAAATVTKTVKAT